jgi:ketosteroid isomerase-like protein
MKIAIACAVMGFLALSHVTNSRAEGSSGDVVKAIAALEDQWSKGEKENNVDLIAPLLADKFMITESDGQMMDRAGFLAEEKSLKYSDSVVEDLKVMVYGDTAIANYALHQKFISKGKAVDAHTRETDTWVKMPDGAWKCVASHGSKIKGK